MASTINANIPRNGDATHQEDSRVNFAAAKTDIEALQAGKSFGVSAAVAALSTTQLGGLAVPQTSAFVQVATATAGSADSLTLPTQTAGKFTLIHNGSGDTINVFPPTGASINGGSANAAVTIATGKARLFYAMSATAIFSLLGA